VHHTALLDTAILFTASFVVALSFQRLRLPPVVGFVVAGALLGPRSFGLVENEALVEQLAEVGVVVLLFTVGLELASGPIGTLRRQIVVAGSLQVGLSVALGALAAWGLGLGLGPSIFLGFLLSLSSTAAITKLLGDAGQVGSPPGRLAVAICIAQDIAVVPMILLLPLLAAGGGEENGASLGATLLGVGRAFVGLALVAGAAVLAVPRLLERVSRTRSRELFVLAVVTICLVMAQGTGALGLSPALGAFLAGFVLARGHHKHQAIAEVEPFRDALSSLFFVSIGMLFDAQVLVEQPVLVGGALAAVVAGKTGVAWLAASALRLPRWVSVRGALMVAQVGEFSFVLVQATNENGILPDRLERVFVVVAALSIAITPALFVFGRYVAARRPSMRGGARAVETGDEPAEAGELRDHVVIVGFGPAGRTLADALDVVDVPYRVIEMNNATVKEEAARGRPIVLGDASRRAVLHAVDIERARVLVVAVNDPRASRQVVAVASVMAPHVRILVRAQYLGDVDGLRAAGADDVVPQELETAIEITVRAMRSILVPDDLIGEQVRAVRDRYRAPRAAPPGGGATGRDVAAAIPGLDMRVVVVDSASEIEGLTLAEAKIRERTGLTVVALQTAGTARPSLALGPTTRLSAGDRVVVIGTADAIEAGMSVFRAPPPEAVGRG
jgi:CPA2 family monovalent cation:H+ antiporter-2